MTLCCCNCCDYIFESTAINLHLTAPLQCPNCGKIRTEHWTAAVRRASETEAKKYMAVQKIQLPLLEDWT